jgi:hypothetical protein
VNGAEEDDRARLAQVTRLHVKGLNRRATLLRTTGREGAARGEAVVVVHIGGQENDDDGEKA